MRKRRKLLKIAGVGLLLGGTLLTAGVVAFVFNPFEGSLPDMRELVPRDVDYFLRKTDLAEDFSDFPEPHFWSEFSTSGSWRLLRGGPSYSELERDYRVTAAIDELRRATRDISESSAGLVELLSDAIGTELILAGTFEPEAYCAYTRVTWKVRFLWGLLQWESVREQFRAGGLDLRASEDGTLTLQQGGAPPLYLARHLDCLLVSNDRAFLTHSLDNARGQTASESFAGSADYRDGVEARLRAWGSQTGVVPNALEYYLRPDQLFGTTRWDDNWPDARHPDDMNERVLASFLNLTTWRFLTGALIFEPDGLTALARIDLNRNKHSGFQSDFFKTEAQDRKIWLDPFLSMVPEGACAAAAMRMPAGGFLDEMYGALDQDLKEIFNEVVRKTGKFDSARKLIESIVPALEPRIGFVFFRARSLGEEVYSNEPSPAPHIAWVFWIRDHKPIRNLYDFLTSNSTTLGFDRAYDLPVVGLRGGDATREFINPNIPGTGEVTILIYGNFFVVSNSGYLVRDMVHARINSRSIVEMPDYKTFEEELPNRLNGFVFVQGERMAEVLEDYVKAMHEGSREIDPEWEFNNQGRIEREVLKSKYQAYSSAGAIPENLRASFERDLDAAKRTEWNKYRARTLGTDQGKLDQTIALMRLFSSAYMQVNLDPQSMQLRSRILLDYR